MITSVTPLGEFSVGRLVENKTENSIALPDSANIDTYDLVKVLGVGDGVVYGSGFYSVKFQPGDLVLVYKTRYDKVKTSDGEVVVFRSSDVVAIVEEEE